mmetsp:Transcript_7196/g.11338  ORF Transcript_7196/g.11338 Transcript_7196/m.11338 type:complete len:85 (+) Transcript_7196:48-302(+)
MWKERQKLLTPFYSNTAKDKKVCKKCGGLNAFFRVECKECKQKFSKIRVERGGGQAGSNMLTTGQISGGINNTENYSVLFWDLI